MTTDSRSQTNSYKFSFNPEFDFDIAVSAVNTFTGDPPSVTESAKSKEVLLSAKKLLTECSQNQTNTTPSIAPVTYSSPSPATTDQSQTKINEIEDRLNNVENRQSRLEQLVNNLFAFLKKILPF